MSWLQPQLFVRSMRRSNVARESSRILCRSNLLAAIGALVLSTLPVQAYAQAPPFVGLWKLTSNQQRLADGTLRQSPLTVAYLYYSETGHMCYVAMDPNRPKWASSPPTPAEALSGIIGLGAYCALVEVHASEGYVLHRVELVKNPNEVGALRKRYFAFEGLNTLKLRVDSAELAPGVAEATLIWQRVTRRGAR